jgi:penicillin G amidase
VRDGAEFSKPIHNEGPGPQLAADILLRIMRKCFFFVLLGAMAAAVQASSFEERSRAAVSVIQGTIKTPGLQKPVRVLRDKWGVAHIYAKNQHDLFFAQGYVVAQDRLFQMELWKRSGQGRLSEVLGPEGLGRDRYARLLRYRGDMQAEYESYSPDTKEILDAFTNGINAYIAQRLKSGLPIEFQIAGFKPEPWKPENCLNRMAAFAMTGNVFRELQHAEVVAALGAEKASGLFDFDPQVKLDPAPEADLSGLSTRVLTGLVGSDTRIEFPRKALEGSNNWTIAGRLTKTGKPLLANDPHRVIAQPSLRYLVHLVAPGWNVIGAGEPGLPGVALGHNQQIAWGFTIFGLDQQDLYIEEVNPENPLQYKTAQGWKAMEVVKETIAVRGQPSVSLELKFTQHGPVLWHEGNRALALHWVGSEPGTAGYLGSLAIDRAKNWDDFEAAMARWKVPSENIVYADRAGNIGEHSTGLEPIRKWTGLLPVPGTGGYEWSGFVPTAELPRSFNPASGYVATANNKMIPDAYPYNVGFEWYSVYRVKRIKEVLDQAQEHSLTPEDMAALQNDVTSIPARVLVGLLREAVGATPGTNEQLLLEWDFKITRESAAGALYEVWSQDVAKAVAQRLVPENVRVAVGELELNQTIEHLSHPRADYFGPNPNEERNQLLRETLKTAAARLTKLQGPDTSKWSWGALHGMKFRHALDQAPGAEAVMNLGPVSRPGDEETVDATGYNPATFQQTSGASYREILDLSDWDNSRAVNTPGQSGQPGSKHYADLLPFWAEGQYFPLVYSKEAVEKVATDILVLKP